MAEFTLVSTRRFASDEVEPLNAGTKFAPTKFAL